MNVYYNMYGYKYNGYKNIKYNFSKYNWNKIQNSRLYLKMYFFLLAEERKLEKQERRPKDWKEGNSLL